MLPSELSQQLQSLVQRDDVDGLLAMLQVAVQQYPQEPEVHHLLGWARMRQRHLEEAIAHLREAVRLKPDAAGSLNNLGLLLLEFDRLGEAIDALKAAVAAQPTFIDALVNLSLALARANLCQHGEFFLQEALRLNPQSADAHHYLGFIYMTLGRLDEAESHLTTALELQPGAAGCLSTMGLLREKQHRIEEATALFQQAVAAGPSLAEPWHNLGGIRAAVWGQYDLALGDFDRALAIRPSFVDARYHRGMVELALGDFERGWTDYEFRPTVLQKSRERYDRPRWQGEPLAGKTILLHCEQGLGDTLQFIRYAPEVKGLGATVFCEVQKQLLPLLALTPSIDALLEEGAPLPPHDYQIPLLSMPQFLGIPKRQSPYLFAARDRLDFWQGRIAQIPGFKIGIAWQGQPGFKYDWLRSIPLSQFAPLARLPSHRLISLQRCHGLEQIAANRETVPVIELDPPLDEAAGSFMDTAAVMMYVDLVITSDTAIAHLAGGLGAAVWLATPYAPDWRWMTARETSPWYPTMRLFRQNQVGRWDHVFERMANKLLTPDS